MSHLDDTRLRQRLCGTATTPSDSHNNIGEIWISFNMGDEQEDSTGVEMLSNSEKLQNASINSGLQEVVQSSSDVDHDSTTLVTLPDGEELQNASSNYGLHEAADSMIQWTLTKGLNLIMKSDLYHLMENTPRFSEWALRKEVQFFMMDLSRTSGMRFLLYSCSSIGVNFPLFLAEKDDGGNFVIRSLTKDDKDFYGFMPTPIVLGEIKRRAPGANSTIYDFIGKKDKFPNSQHHLMASLKFFTRKSFVKVFNLSEDKRTSTFNSKALKVSRFLSDNWSLGNRWLVEVANPHDDLFNAFAFALAKVHFGTSSI